MARQSLRSVGRSSCLHVSLGERANTRCDPERGIHVLVSILDSLPSTPAYVSQEQTGWHKSESEDFELVLAARAAIKFQQFRELKFQGRDSVSC